MALGWSGSNGGITVKKAQKISFKLKEKDFSFYKLVSLSYAAIASKKAVNYYGSNFKMNPVGTGPFTLKEYKSGGRAILAKNGDYWEKTDEGKNLPAAGEINISLAEDNNLSLMEFKNGKTDFLELTLPLEKQLESMDMPFSYKMETKQFAQLNFYLFNLDKIADKDIRKGISHSIDRSAIQDILFKEGDIAKSLYPSAIFSDISGEKDLLEHSPDSVREYLEGKNIGRPLKIVSFDDALSRSIAESIGKSLKDSGIDSAIESVPFSVLVDRLTNGDYDLIQLYWGPLYSDESHYLTPFLSSSLPPAGNNFNKYQNPEFDRLVSEAKKAPNPEHYYKDAEDVILGDMPFLLLYFKNTIRVSNQKYNLPIHPLGYKLYKYAEAN